MTLGKRRRIFYSLIVAFFILGGGAILFVNGWRFDFKTFKFDKVGGIFVRSFPDNAKIFLDNRPVKNDSGLLQRGTLISGLFPGSHDLKLVTDGYKLWQESISVLPSLVSEAKYAVLIPEETRTITTGTFKNFWVVGDKIIMQNWSDGLFRDGEKIGTGEISGWTKDSKNILIFNSSAASWSSLNTDTAEKINLGSIFKRAGFRPTSGLKLIVDTENQNQLLLLEPKRISMIDVEKSQLVNVYKTSSAEIEDVVPATQSLIVWSEFSGKQNNSLLVIYDRFLKRTRYGSPVFPGKTVKLAWLPTKKIAALQDNSGFYLYDIDKNESTKIADDVKNFTFSKNTEFLATLENKSLEIFSLSDGQGYHRFNLPDVGRAEKVIWYFDKNHLFVVYPDHFVLLDTNDGSLRNFATIASGTHPQYDEETNQLYFLDGKGVERLNFPK